MSERQPSDSEDNYAVAVTGMSCRFPGARNVEAFWRIVRDGIEAVSFFSEADLLAKGVDPALLADPNYVRAGAVLEDADLFDATFFGYFPREVEIMDPQQRLFLECAWEALENAGISSDQYEGLIGVFGGTTINTYQANVLRDRRIIDVVGDLQAMIGNDKDFVTTRVSHKLDLKGPSYAVQTACSTSLVAVHVACRSLLSGECDLALAGGASVRIPQGHGYLYLPGGTSSPDGHCRAFDARAAGSIVGSGAGVVVLKRLLDALADGDTIYAVVKGSAINNDGAAKAGFSTPSSEGQARVIRDALAAAGVEAETISYVEAHGTGTNVGDPIEVAGLTRAFRTSKARQFCALGSVKTNIGHLDAAAGISGMIKTVLALQHRLLPPTLNFESPNPQIDFANSPFYVNTRLKEWKTADCPRRAGVTSIGLGGANAHLILEEAPQASPTGPARPWHLLVLSAKTPTALEAMSANLAAHLRGHVDINLADVAYTLQTGRRAFPHRRAVVCRDVESALTGLHEPTLPVSAAGVVESSDRPIVFLFPGQGTQHPNMAASLYREEPAFREQVDACASMLARQGFDLYGVLLQHGHAPESAQRADQTSAAQPALFVVEYALARLWMSWGIQPQALLGHSIGEYVAACLAGVFTIEDALKLVLTRGRLMQSMPPGRMLAVQLAEHELQPYLTEDLSLAAVNGPTQCVLSGCPAVIERVQQQLEARGAVCHLLRTSQAFHSAMMDPVVGPFAEVVRSVARQKPHMRFISSVSGTWLGADEATDPDYWARQIRRTVRFGDGLNLLLQDPPGILLEVGPGQTLSRLARATAGPQSRWTLLSSMPSAGDLRSELEFLLRTLGQLWLAGVRPDWKGFHGGQRRQRLPLPAYPFERQRFWLDPQTRAMRDESKGGATPVAGKQLVITAEELVKGCRQILSLWGADQLVISARTEASSLSPSPRAAPICGSSVPEHVPTGSNGARTSHNPVEENIIAIWKELVGPSPINPHDNFFELGAHSLLATQLLSRLRKHFHVELSMEELFHSPTVAGLAATIARRQSAKEEETVERLLREIESMTPEQVKQELFRNGAGLEKAADTTNGSQRLCQGAPASGAGATAPAVRSMQFSLFFFSDQGSAARNGKYHLLLESARFADQNGFCAVWTPERHFHEFGGPYPNPSVLAAALAVATKRLQIRAGSVVVPLHHPIRIAEEWSVVDNLSGGRVGVAFASGWHPDDFVLARDPYPERREATFRAVDLIQRLWAGEAVPFRGDKAETLIRMYPRPVQERLPLWITSSGNPATWAKAGELGANVLTGMMEQTLEELARNIRTYRDTLARHGHDPHAKQVTLMLHTYLGDDLDVVRAKVKEPLLAYFRTHLGLYERLAKSQDIKVDLDQITERDREALLQFGFERYFSTSALLGTPSTCTRMIERLQAAGVDEVACLINFGLDFESVMGSLERLKELQDHCALGSANEARIES